MYILFKVGILVSMENLSLLTAFHPGFHCMLTFPFVHILPKLTAFIELVIVIPSLDTFNLSLGPTAVPMIRVPRVRTNLAT